ncbi:hypothetical protein KHM83_14915 [Fusibacter paucivorans]|uniref:Uncharacterized protein n=1 Tax=Fusibacter paucivorans TaxID=76009 RepID=A0ABS5PS31_9FIRM|nr:hypothetical protein [Fusibacter paucivorans]MBS7527975.1 hypothetical protein [Fusibacter paucivorans]
MKKWMIVLVAFLVIGMGYAGYQLQYPIDSAFNNLHMKTSDWLNRGSRAGTSRQITIYDGLMVKLGNAVYVPMTVDESLGYVLLNKSLAGRYKIVHTAYGTGNFKNGVVEIDGERYLLFMGRNTFGEIAKAVFVLDANHTVELEIPTQPVFLVYADVADDAETAPIMLDKLTLFDADDRDISSVFDLSGGSIQ